MLGRTKTTDRTLTEKPRIPLGSILLYGFWPGFIKTFLYRLKGYKIGKGVSIGLGAVVCGDRVEIGDHTSIGFLTVVRGTDIRLGPYVHIGSLTFLDTPYLEIGEGTNINEQVYVGGLQFPDSRLVVGKNCSIMQLSFINPARPILIGDGCVIGGHCLIFTHSSSLSRFEGYPAEFAPIEIGDNVGLAWRSFVLPGAKIGDGTMVGANSVVSGVIPPESLAVGYPARIVGRRPVFPKPVSDDEKVTLFRGIVDEMIRFLCESGFSCERNGESYEVRMSRGRLWKARAWRMIVTDDDVRQALKDAKAATFDVFLSLREVPADVREFLNSRNIMWIDVASKAQGRKANELGNEILSYFRRHGLRTLRYPRSSAPFVTSSSPDRVDARTQQFL